MVTAVYWYWKPFEALSLLQWHDLLKLRIDVFVVEQHCPYPELDGKDPDCLHVLGEIDGQVFATARIVPAGISYVEVSIGRVAVAKEFRGHKYGEHLMKNCLLAIQSHYGNVPVRLSAQAHLKQFYEDFDFVPTGKSYLEDGIPHIEMYRTVFS